MEIAFSIWTGDRLFDLVDDLADAAFGGRGGMGGNMTIITGPRLTDQGVPGTALGSAV